MQILRLKAPVEFLYFHLFPDLCESCERARVRSRECMWSLSLLSPAWCTQRRNGRKSGTNCWSSPPVSQEYTTAPTAPSGMVNSSHNAEPVKALHAHSRVSFQNVETVTNVNRVIGLIPMFFIFIFLPVTKRCMKADFEPDSERCCCPQGGVLRWTRLREFRGVSRLCVGPRSQKARCGGGWHHAEGLWRRR